MRPWSAEHPKGQICQVSLLCCDFFKSYEKMEPHMGPHWFLPKVNSIPILIKNFKPEVIHLNVFLFWDKTDFDLIWSHMKLGHLCRSSHIQSCGNHYPAGVNLAHWVIIHDMFALLESYHFYLPHQRCGRGNRIGPICLCVHLCICASISTLTAEPLDLPHVLMICVS